MKTLALITAFLFSLPLFAQEDKVGELISKGIALHDLGKYEEAISQYKAALEIDKRSTTANYEIAYSYFMIRQYDKAIHHSKAVIEQNKDNLHEAYMVLGSSLDLTGKPDKAIKAYEEGLQKFPNSNLLNYNLGLTCHNQKDFKKAEKAAIAAINARPEHGSSHVLLSSIMQQTSQRVKSILPIYYFLLLEPASSRSLPNYDHLQRQLGRGVDKKDDKSINITIPVGADDKDDFGAAEMMISLLAASKHTEENKNKSDMELFIETNEGIFSVLGELKAGKKGFWWDLYVTRFYDLVKSGHVQAFSYYISQSAKADEVNKWISDNDEKMQKLMAWIEK